MFLVVMPWGFYHNENVLFSLFTEGNCPSKWNTVEILLYSLLSCYPRWVETEIYISGINLDEQPS